MLKARTILCIALAVIVGRAAAQNEFSFEELLGNIGNGLPPSSGPTGAMDVALTAAVDALASYLPSLENIEQGLRRVITDRQAALQRTYGFVVNEMRRIINVIDVNGASWQKKEQTLVLDEFKAIKDVYQRVTALHPTKDFTQCEAILKKIADFLTAMGSDFYSCHYYYNNIINHLAKRIFPNKKTESDTLKDLAQVDCKVAAAQDTSSKAEALGCLINTGIQFYSRSNSDIALTTIVESALALVADQNRYFHSCPAYAKWHIYAQTKSVSLASLQQCVNKAIST